VRLGRSRLAVLLLSLAALLYLNTPSPPAGPPLEWRSDLEAALLQAAERGQPVILSFHAAWCSVCRKLDERSLRSPRVAEKLEGFVRVRVDAGGSDRATLELLERFGVRVLPELVFVDASGRVLEQPRVQGYAAPDRLAALLAGL
jgi:thiol:disulfide interchange protein DsbD